MARSAVRTRMTLTVAMMLALATSGRVMPPAQAAEAQSGLPRIVVLATGGTIAGAAATVVQAGYKSGQVGVDQLLAAVPPIAPS